MSNYEAEAIISAGTAIGQQKILRPEGEPTKQFLIVPEGYKAQEIDVERLYEAPYRNKGTVEVATVDSFLRFVERELVPETTVCFADQESSEFKAIVNYSGGGNEPGWSDRIVVLSLKRTTAWGRWSNNDEVKMNQLAFADFIEANMADVSEPDAATIIEMIKQLKVHRKAEFTSVVDPRTGFTNLTFNEQTSGETLKGNIEFFGRFVLGLAPYRGSDKYKVDAWLRFNINEQNKLLVYYSMINADLVEEHAFAVEREKVLAGMIELKVPVFDV